MILPFAGLELLLLGWALRKNYRACQTQEVVEIGDHYVRVAVGRLWPERVCEFQREWTRVLLLPAKITGRHSQLLLRSAGRQVEIGRCLNDVERSALFGRLQELIEGLDWRVCE